MASADALVRQFECAFGGLRDIISKLPDDQWDVGATDDQVPARRVTHAIASARHHCHLPRSAGSGLARGTYRCREDMLAWLEDTARGVETALNSTTDEQFSVPTRRFRNGLEHWLYALRHLQHHVGQLSSTLRERRLRPMKWH